MNKSTLQYLALAICASILIAGGRYLAADQRAAGDETKKQPVKTESAAKTDVNSGSSAAAGSAQANANEHTPPSELIAEVPSNTGFVTAGPRAGRAKIGDRRLAVHLSKSLPFLL